MKKILIVDDDADLREVMKTVLQDAYEIREAPGKEAGLALLKTYTPNLVLLDVMMETNSAGFEMARAIRENPKTRNIKILMLTNIDKELNLNFKASAKDPDWLPVDDFLEKPINPKQLRAKIGKLI